MSRSLMCGSFTSRLIQVASSIVATLATAPLLAASPVAVSPGGDTDFRAVYTACPTFSWSAVPGAAGYELHVYEVAEAGTSGRGVPVGQPAPLRRQSVPAGALSWTPSAGDCLEIFGRYTWTVRAIGADGEWAGSRMFTIDPDPVVQKIAGALEKYFEAMGFAIGTRGELAALIRKELEQDLDAPAADGDPGAKRVALRGELIAAPELPALLSQQLATESDPEAAGDKRVAYHGEMVPARNLAVPGDPSGVFNEDVEMRLTETGSGISDYVQLVFDTPAATGSSAWSLAVRGSDGRMFLSAPNFLDAIQFFTDASVLIPELRDLRLRNTDTPPATCTAGAEGYLYWDESLSKLCACDGSSWKQVDGGEAC